MKEIGLIEIISYFTKGYTTYANVVGSDWMSIVVIFSSRDEEDFPIFRTYNLITGYE